MKMIQVFFLFMLVVMSVNFISCASRKDLKSQSAIAEKDEVKALSQEEAAERVRVLSNIKYDLQLNLANGKDSFFGEETVYFDLSQLPSQLFIEFRDGKIEYLKLNDDVIVSPAKQRSRLNLPQKSLKIGRNQLFVRFEQNYVRNGQGLHRFEDPEDKKSYIYSQFEAYDAHHMFVCFDQPDLKATYKLSVQAPKQWEVVSTGVIESKTDLSKELRHWTFKETPKLSTFGFGLQKRTKVSTK